jgi:hypothetical protein
MHHVHRVMLALVDTICLEYKVEANVQVNASHNSTVFGVLLGMNVVNVHKNMNRELTEK